MSILQLEGVSKSYGSGKERVEVLSDINLAIEEGEFVAIVGFTGSGKTTLINLINGLLFPDQGMVLFKGEPVTGPGPERGVVFQNYSLLPWLSVYQNIYLAVDQVDPGASKKAKDEMVRKYVGLVNLTPALGKKPAELSGGMRQRVSLARTLAMGPEVLLMDEPLSALDALTRAVLQKEIINIWTEDRRTALLITNDVDEGIIMADRIIPLNPGPKATLGPNFTVPFERPRNLLEINEDPLYKKLRNEIIEYLIEMGNHKQSGLSDSFELPDLEPVMPGRIFLGNRERRKKVKYF